MATDSKQISVPQSGMVRDLHPSNLGETQYTFAMNANIESEDGNVNMRSNEHSTLKCTDFGGYKIVGYKNDLSSNLIYFFITNPEDGTSKIVYMEPCEDVSTLSEEQISSSVNGELNICGDYRVLIEDSVDDPCLKFSIYHPIKTIEIKVEKCGKSIYWTDGYNPPRYVIVEKALEPDDEGDIWYHYHGYKLCKYDYDRDSFIKENGCVLACEKLRVFPLLDQPCIEPVQIEYGGGLRGGVYQFAVALCDEFGNEKTSYSSLTNPIHIFDRQYIRIHDGKWGERTNLGIRLRVSNLDRQVGYYKIAVIQNTVGYNGETQPVLDYFIEGVHPITETTILYYSDLNNKRTTFEHLSLRRAVYNTSRGIVAVDNRLLQYGLTAEKEWNLQPMASLLGHFLKWHCGVAHEDLYKDGNACSLYVGYMRNEVYPFAISFKTSTGYKTPAFVLVPPPYEGARDKVEDPDNDIVYQSISQYAPDCSGNIRQYKWQYTNTAGNVEDLEIDGETGAVTGECSNVATIGKTAVYESNFYHLIDPGDDTETKFRHTNKGVSVIIETDTVIGSVIQYFADHLFDLVCNHPYEDSNGTPDEGAVILCEIMTDYDNNTGDSPDEIFDDNLTEIDGIETPDPSELGNNCTVPKRQTSIISCPVQSIESFKEDYIYKTLDKMAHVSTDYLYSAGGESQNKYSLMFDYEIADEMEEYLEKQMLGDGAGQYSGDGDQRLKSDLQPYFQYGNVLKAISDSTYILDNLPCTCGCNENDICDNPSINQKDYNAFQNSPTFVAAHILEYDIWNREGDHKGLYNVDRPGGGSNVYSCYNPDGLDDYRAGRSTSTVRNDAYNSHVAPQQIIDIWWNNEDPEKNVKNRIIEDYSLSHLDLGDSSIYPERAVNENCSSDEAAWIWTVYTNLAQSMELLPAETEGQPQLAATTTAYRFMRYVTRTARFIRIDRPSEWDEPDYPERNKVLYLEGIGKTEGTRDAMSPEVIRISFWYDIDEDNARIIDRGPDFDFNENGVYNRDPNNRFYIVSIDRPGFSQIDETFFAQFPADHKYFYAVIESPIVFVPWLFTTRQIQYVEVNQETGEESDGKKPSKGICGGTFAIGKTTYPYIFGIREKEIDKINVYAKNLQLSSTAVFQSQCETCGDKPINCAPRPYKQGDFAYWESTELYPANFELYDSKRLKVNSGRTYEDSALNEAKNKIISKLTEYYGNPVDDGDGLEHFEGTTLGSGGSSVETSTTFCQQPIRHYKFPDNHIMPFMNSDTRVYDTPSEIYPIGVLIDEDIINVFLDFAVDSGLITKEQRDTVVGYEIYRGDRRLNRSVIATGVAYDMYKWIGEDGKINIYANYPYNDLSDDYYIYKTHQRYTTVNHPFHKEGNVWYSFCSPDIYFNKPEMPTEVSVEGFLQGASVGSFVEVEDHPKWTILGSRAYRMASTLASIEATATIAAQIAEALQIRAQSAYVGLVTNLSVAMLFTSMITTISDLLSKIPVLYGKYRYDWLNTFINNGPRRNHGYYYTSVGYYNSMTTFLNEDQYNRNRLRGLSTVKEIKGGLYPIYDSSILSDSVRKSEVDDYEVDEEGNLIYINNIDRESSMFFSFGEPTTVSENEDGAGITSYKYLVNYPTHVRNYDDSRVTDSVVRRTDPIAGEVDKVQKYLTSLSVPYMKAMRYVPDQYGGIENIRWVSITDVCSFKGGLRQLYGGDIYISRFSMKRKFPFFYNNAFGIGDMIPFPYMDYRNVGFPRYFVNYDTGDDMLEITDNERFNSWTSSHKGTYTFYPNRKSLYELNGFMEDDKYVKGRFYLWMYGIPQFLVESEINCNFRLEGSQPNEWFYPSVGDFIWWTQEKNVSIRMDNDYRISPIYFSRTTFSPMILPATYERKFYDCAYQRPNGVIWSRSDVSENSQTDPWLTYKPLDYHEFPARNGKLIHMKRIESNQILTRFEDQVSLNNAIDVIKERTVSSAELGTGGLFASRPLEYNTTDLGYSGTQSTEIVSSEYGHFWVDAKRAQVFMTDPNGKNLQELSVGISHWLKNHLPFKILKYGIINTDTGESMTYEDADNKFVSLGLSLGWDNLYKRVFITKKDYIPVKDASMYKFSGGRFYYGDSEISVHDSEYFEDVSFTLAYSCKKKEWVSYYSFCPDLYIEQQQHFISGKNYSSIASEVGLWSHLLTNRSFQTFYGTTYPFMLEVPVKETYNGSILASVEYELDARKYSDNVNYTLDRKVGLDSVVIYNETNNSGELRLVPEEKNNMYQKVSYPRYGDFFTEILDTEVYRRHKINEFFNRVADDRSDVPVWNKDSNDIDKELNPVALEYHPTWLDRLRGSWFLMRLKKTISDTKIIFQWMISEDKRKNR